MTNGIPYPIHPEFKKAIEEKRKQFAMSQGVKVRSVSQARFTKLLAPVIKGCKINIRPIINKNAIKKIKI